MGLFNDFITKYIIALCKTTKVRYIYSEKIKSRIPDKTYKSLKYDLTPDSTY